ncbi:MAG: NADH-quinone oxidoreductase subunit C [Proteobacteria bacterium]|nr:NADH-quinone oxidoreductase subunit C [Pseudomonadota bacterium]MBU1232171.1 NADH-quinone oxidoreductase subunit C [Pseudomonadota bacterium]MBU1419580.1 NADH-quinone oxidoreductase subunit C [Pseudomonadota bacterium]MBU1455870.1 NADH-quinone oxidoreductase subunit C [Pseudomonadota bacterium]
MIKDTIKKALQELFPVPEPVVAETPPTEAAEGEETKAKKTVKEGPRVNGVIERDYNACGYHLDAQVDPGELLAAVLILDKAGFFIESITGVDWIKEDQLEVIYDFSRYDFDLCRVVIRTRTPRTAPKVPTISKIFSGANWHERETHDFFGIKFEGHPHLIPLLLPEDADFHPLLKDFKP